MEINEALSVAKQLKNHFKAFEKLDDFVKEIAAGQVLLKDLQHRADALSVQIEELTKRWGELTSECERWEARAEKAKVEAEKNERELARTREKILKVIGEGS